LLHPENLDYEISKIERYHGFLVPGFINAHCHLELSWAEGMIQPRQGLNDFVLLLENYRQNMMPDTINHAVIEQGNALFNSGTVGMADVVNTADTCKFKEESPIRFHNFCEVFASDPEKAGQAFSRAAMVRDAFIRLSRNNSATLVPHAPYSLSEELFRLVLDTEQTGLLSIHHQESDDENRFFFNGSGDIAHRRKFFNPGISPFKCTGKRPLESISGYFRKEQPLLLVHNTFSTEEDLDFARGYFNNLSWCLCPNSNLFIENRLPNIELLRNKGCNLVIGTDSLASNRHLSILEEIKTIHREFPEIPLCELISWATANGASLFGFESLGTFEQGKQPGVVLIEDVDTDQPGLLPGSRSRLIVKPGDDSIRE
jgi:cytosine/adenosine deaminase-related metal-dependent hydrolase